MCYSLAKMLGKRSSLDRDYTNTFDGAGVCESFQRAKATKKAYEDRLVTSIVVVYLQVFRVKLKSIWGIDSAVPKASHMDF
jgi:hypothetical protein